VKKIRTLLALAATLLLFTGCVNMRVKLKILPDGSVEQNLNMGIAPELAGIIGADQVQETLNSTQQKLQAEGWDTTLNALEIQATRKTKGAGWAGGTLDVGLAQMMSGNQNNQPVKLQRNDQIFVDNVRLDMDFGDVSSMVNPASRMFMDSMKLEVAVETPWQAKLQNATSINGNEYTWRLSLSDANKFYVEYQIIRWDRIMIALAAAALVAFVIWRVRMAKPSNLAFQPAGPNLSTGMQSFISNPTPAASSLPDTAPDVASFAPPALENTPTVRVQITPRQTGFNLTGSTGSFTLPLAPAIATVGRSNADVTIPDSSISVAHARIVIKDDTLDIIDMGSTNGTLVNGQPIPARQAWKVSAGDAVQFGLVKLEVKKFVAKKLSDGRI
jgi:FHA domain/Protein of unknown function (DUF3153)